jgi:ubiquitin carboxyl-terminal hydrolase 7
LHPLSKYFANFRRINDLESQGLYSNPAQFYDFLQNRVMIVFKPRYDDQGDDDFHLVFSKKQNYDIVRRLTIIVINLSLNNFQMSAKAGEHLRHDPIKLRFTTTNTTGAPKSILKRSLNQSIAEIMTPSYANPATTIIMFEKLDVSIVELETKRSLKVTWTGIHNKEEGTHAFLLPKTSMVHDLADHLGKLVSLSSNGTCKIRIFEISKDGKTQKEFTGSEMIGNIPEPVDLYAEVCSHPR